MKSFIEEREGRWTGLTFAQVPDADPPSDDAVEIKSPIEFSKQKRPPAVEYLQRARAKAYASEREAAELDAFNRWVDAHE